MVTTIQISEEMKEKLEKLKTQTENTYEKVIEKALNIREPNLTKLYGMGKNKGWNKKRDRLNLDD